MRKFNCDDIIIPLSQAIGQSAYNLSKETMEKFLSSRDEETGLAKEIFNDIIENAQIASKGDFPLCQDTGYAVCFVKIGREIFIEGNIDLAINEAVRVAYRDFYLRKSIVADPLTRVNTKDNTPAVIYYEFVDGDKLTVQFMLKGGGSENVTQIKMFNPTSTADDIADFVVKVVKDGGPNPCPPLVVGVGIGGTIDKALQLAKKSMLREIGSKNSDEFYDNLEKEIQKRVNEETNVGPAGFGGKTTALAVFVDKYPCHIASLPVAVNVNCHSIRHGEVVL